MGSVAIVIGNGNFNANVFANHVTNAEKDISNDGIKNSNCNHEEMEEIKESIPEDYGGSPVPWQQGSQTSLLLSVILMLGIEVAK
jgi:hypothetical protein